MEECERLARQRELIEELGLLYETMGSTRMAGRVAGWLLLCDPPVQSLTEIAGGLGVSKAAVSGAVRFLLQGNHIERASRPGSRGDHYRARDVDFAEIVDLERLRALHGIFARALATVADKDPSQPNYALIRDVLDFTAFMQAELPGLLARWYARRVGDAPRVRPARTADTTAQLAGGAT